MQVTDTSEEHPLLFVKENEEHPFTATALSIQSGVAVPIVPVSEYSWAWSPWTTSDGTVVEVTSPAIDSQTATIRAKNKNGSAFAVATLRIVEDTVFTPPTKDRVVQGTAPVTVMLCENPWPSLHDAPIAPFRDKQSTGVDSSLAGTIFEDGPFFNFSTIYCRDGGEFGDKGDLPKLKINYVPPTTTDKVEGILRQYLFTYPDEVPELKKDGIGIRIAANPLHLSPEDWYRMLGFGGSPKSIKVDGYRALQDGTTTYVAAANTDGPGKRIYSNVYIISHNPDATPVTVGIYDQMVKSLTFNINIEQGVANVCLQGSAPTDYGADLYVPEGTNRPVACSADVDCLKIYEKLHCGSFKLKLARDTERVADFAAMSRTIEKAKESAGTYPKLAAGTFLQGFSTSLWPSWYAEMSSVLGGTPPADPVNQFLSCGRCSQSRTVCGTKDDCPTGQTCGGVSYQNGEFISSTTTEAATCWNTEERKYYCPSIEGSPSRVYQYRSVNAGVRYELSAEFEVPEPTTPSEEWWSPALMSEVKRCTNAERNGTLCDVDADCRDCVNPKDNVSCTKEIENGSCRTVGGRVLYRDICTNMAYGQSGTCGDGVIGSACAGGVNNGKPCVDDVGCSGGSCTASEACEIGQTRIADCRTAGDEAGLKLQTCNECVDFVDDVNLSKCDASLACGNGRIDRKCNGGARPGMGCLADADCAGNATTPAGTCGTTNEVCDDGSLNGTYGKCNVDCTGYAAYCGDGMISPGEICDNEGQNGAYCDGACNVNLSCSLNCKEHAPHCGDGLVSAPESCDGQTETTVQAICLSGTAKDQPCATDADCGEGGTCASGADDYKSCQGVTRNRCATSLKQCVSPSVNSCVGYVPGDHRVCQTDADCANEDGGETACRALSEFCVDCSGDAQCSYIGIPGTCNVMPTAHVRSCNTPSTPNQCSYAAWSGCEVQSFCGDGIIDTTGEECDDGSGNGDTKACTASCKKNTCGDGKPYVGVEECDAGSQNGSVTCNADYGSTCASCSTQCRFLTTAGGYCGDATKNGPEQCDGNVPVTNISNQYACPGSGRPSQVCPYVNADCIQSPCQKTNEAGVKCTQLGYDFPLNGVKPKLFVLDATDTFLNGTRSSACSELDGIKRYEYLMFTECLGMTCHDPLQINYKESVLGSEKFFTRLAGINDNAEEGNPEQTLNWIVSFQNPMPSENAFWQCVKEKGPALGVGIKVDAAAELVQCNASCAFSGCGKCSDEVGTGVIKGQLWDGVYGQVIPFARVSVYYKGTLVQQVASDADGKFTISGLNNRKECGQYKIVADKYDDNPCTGTQGQGTSCGRPSAPPWMYAYNVDEGERGGYWPYTSPMFEVSKFKEMVAFATPDGVDAQIMMYPRPAPGEAYFAVTTGDQFVGGAKGGRNNHLILPKQFAFTPKNSNDPANFTPMNCDWDKRPTADHRCARDVTHTSELRGSSDLNVLPYANLTCPHRPGDMVSAQVGIADAESGCPVEGCAACLASQADSDTPKKCGSLSDWDEDENTPKTYKCDAMLEFDGACTAGDLNAPCSSDADCSTDDVEGVCDLTDPCPNQYWETCNFVNKGPLVTYFRYSAFTGAVEPIRMMFDSKGGAGDDKYIWTNLNGSVNFVKDTMQSKDYAAVVSTDQRIVYLEADDLILNCEAGNCKFWHLADLDATTGNIFVKNELIQERKGPSEGVAVYHTVFNGGSYNENSTNPTKYCAEDVGPDPQGSGVTLYKLYKPCTQLTKCPTKDEDGYYSNCKDCRQTGGDLIPNVDCRIVNNVSFQRANY
ncbi:MAG: carboxypeptidase-like regulatory domain-containing protein [Patescibacteria group bacterium]